MKPFYGYWIAVFFLFSGCQARADNYNQSIAEQSDSGTALLVIDMYESFQHNLSGSASVWQRIAQIAEAISSAGGVIVSISDRSQEKYIPDVVIPRAVKERSQGQQYYSLDKSSLSAFQDGRLLVILQKHNIQRLVIVGAYTHLCIKQSAIAALKQLYPVTLFFDAVTAYAQSNVFFLHGKEGEDELVEFYALMNAIADLGLDGGLTVICAPSRNADKKDRFDPDPGRGVLLESLRHSVR